ncbi:elongation of very long chain fatty acids protein 5-like [Oncorhynchus mykiss]|uniref:elongation of very long chain fatty acids protein 5-like n=1 Tax=Oncorhynchus mykiss TaxID=8022 RepID=UPI0018775948|nr:elongation of very long chain fatty acids protein 5-like [Oncorhynchus mykiss]
MLSLCPSPVPITCIFMCYLLLIGVGPKLMAQTASQPQPVLIVYNFAMVCMSACMFYEMAKVCWWFYSSKVIEHSDIEEEQSLDLPTCLPPRHHDLQLVGWGQVRGRSTSHSHHYSRGSV